jgi:hypothetical protein
MVSDITDFAATGYKIGSGVPAEYKLGRRPSGEVVLLGCFKAVQFDANGVAQGEVEEWRELPTEALP